MLKMLSQSDFSVVTRQRGGAEEGLASTGKQLYHARLPVHRNGWTPESPVYGVLP